MVPITKIPTIRATANDKASIHILQVTAQFFEETIRAREMARAGMAGIITVRAKSHNEEGWPIVVQFGLCIRPVKREILRYA
jgi:hypothetical protein